MADPRRILSTAALAGGLILGTTCAALSAVTGFVSSPAANAGNWATHVTGTGATISTIVDFESHPIGPLDGNFYSAQGVTMTISTPRFQGVLDVTGVPSGSTDCPCSTGEGPFPLSRALIYSDQVILRVSFSSAISAFGMLTGDHYDPAGDDPITIEAFTGTDGTGASLGSFTSAPFNFQLGYSYFMGLASNANNIRSIVISDAFSGTNDGVDLDNFQVGVIGVPEPGSLAILACSLLGLARLRQRTLHATR